MTKRPAIVAAVVVIVVAAGCSSPKYPSADWPCPCIDGYDCHPETGDCVPIVAVGCNVREAICPSATGSGDQCSDEGAFIPCVDGVDDCAFGCRTCGADMTWGDCSIGTCENLGSLARCGDCRDDCGARDHIDQVSCDTTVTPNVCVIDRCADGFSDVDNDQSTGCEHTCQPAEVCNGIDDDCNGVDDDNATDCLTFYRDDDNDGFGQTGDTVCECAPAAPYTATVDGDCDDTSADCTTDCSDLDVDLIADCRDDCTDVDSDGLGVGNLGNAGCINNTTDLDDADPLVCADTDLDLCDDCSSSAFDPANDGIDTDSDGDCDRGDTDDDDDTVLDVNDTDRLDAFVCQDLDGDNCDDCAVTGGPPDTTNDGFDPDGDGTCERGVTNDARLVYVETTTREVLTRAWDNSLTTWGAPAIAYTSTDPVSWVINRLSPKRFEELIAAQSSDGSTVTVTMTRWDGTAWIADWSTTGIGPVNDNKRGFDLAYEAISGHGMVVYSDGSFNPRYRTWDGAGWSAELAVFPAPVGTGIPVWVELVLRPGTDELALIYVDDQSDLYAVIWDGNSWDQTTETTLSTTMSTIADSQAFDAAYESVSGELLVVFGHVFGGEGELKYARRQADSSVWTVVAMTNAQRSKVVDLAAEPGSDRIVAVLTEGIGDNDMSAMTWTGDAWTRINQDLDGTGTGNDRDAAIGWVGTSGIAVLIYKDADAGAEIDWARSSGGGGWSVQSDIPVTGLGELVDVQIETFPNRDELFALFTDDLGNLVAARYDGFTWIVTAPTPLAADLARGGFHFRFQDEPKLILSQAAGGQLGDAFGENGAETDAPLFAFSLRPSQSSPITVNQIIFRLRDLSGLTNADWADIELVVNDGSGASVAGGGTVDTANGTLTFAPLLRVDGPVELLLRADFTVLDSGDGFTLSLGRSDITTIGNEAVLGKVSDVPHRERGTQTLPAGDGRIVFGVGNAASPRMIRWNGASSTWSPTQAPISANAIVKWIDGEVSPVSGEELVGVLSRSLAGSSLDILRFDGSVWNVDWSSNAIPPNNAEQRGFDIAFAHLSGEALVVYSDDTNNPAFRTWDGATWSAPQGVFAFPPSTGVPRFIDLTVRPGSDEMTLVYCDSVSDLNAATWNGVGWDPASTFKLSATLSTVTESQAFDVAYEHLSGDVLVVFGHQFASEVGVRYGVRLADSIGWTLGLMPGATRTKVARLEGEPLSDRIAAVVTEGRGDDDLGVMLWNGTDWRTVINDFDGTASGTAKDVGLGWAGTSGSALMVYTDSADAADLSWASWSRSSNWRIGADVAMGGMVDLANITMQPVPGMNALTAVIADTDPTNAISNLFVATFDQSGGWTPANNGQPIDFGLSSTSTEPLTFYVRPRQELRLMNARAGQLGDAFTGVGSRSQAELFSFRLSPSSGPGVTVEQFSLRILDVQGLLDADWAQVELVIDDDGDGTLSAGETTTVGGPGIVTQGASLVGFASSFLVDAETNIVLRANFASLSPGDELNLVLQSDAFVTTGLVPVVGSTAPTSHVETPLTPLATNQVRLTYATASSPFIKMRTLDAGSLFWSAEEGAAVAGRPARWLLHEMSPSTSTEWVAVVSQPAGGARLEMLRWDGSAWSTDWIDTSISMQQGNRRGLDMAREAISEDIVVVYTDGSANPLYRVWNGSVWSAPARVFTVAPGATEVRWIELTPHPTADEITMFYVDAGNSLRTLIWDGAVWDEAGLVQLATTMSTTTVSRAFDAVYESVSGDLIAVWGHAPSAEDTVQAGERLAATGLWTTVIFNDAVRSRVVRLAAEPGSDRVAAALSEGTNDDDVGGMIWNGTTWGSRLEWDGTGDSDYDIGVAWVGTTGTAVVVYADAGMTGSLNWWTWDGTNGWAAGLDVPMASTGELVAVQMVSLVGQNRVVAVISDTDLRGMNARMFGATFDGSSWTLSNAGQPLAQDLPLTSSRPFDLTLAP